MSMSDYLRNGLLEHILNNAAIADIGDAAGLPASVADGDLYISLLTADPGPSGDQTTNEISYTGYARVAITRDGSGWIVAGNSASPAADISFGKMTAGAGGTVTHIGIGTAASGAGNLLLSGETDPDQLISNNVIPILESTTNIVFT